VHLLYCTTSYTLATSQTSEWLFTLLGRTSDQTNSIMTQAQNTAKLHQLIRRMGE